MTKDVAVANPFSLPAGGSRNGISSLFFKQYDCVGVWAFLCLLGNVPCTQPTVYRFSGDGARNWLTLQQLSNMWMSFLQPQPLASNFSFFMYIWVKPQLYQACSLCMLLLKSIKSKFWGTFSHTPHMTAAWSICLI